MKCQASFLKKKKISLPSAAVLNGALSVKLWVSFVNEKSSVHHCKMVGIYQGEKFVGKICIMVNFLYHFVGGLIVLVFYSE